ncbi:hypothetical protein ACIQ4I_00200 [Rummeliibacillus sp. NPDC094406]|uniref:hypothetical protein n=1 Tax=Rummeliibacillus sp. NPDC094406 TaxID=3364511 RepID=UPI003827A504
MKYRNLLFFSFLLFILALFGCTEISKGEKETTSPIVQSNSEISSLTDKEFLDVGGFNDLKNPTKENFKKVEIKINISNFDTLKNPKINISDNWRSIFGDNYWFGSGSTEDDKFTYNYKMILYTENLTDEEIKRKLKATKYEITWKNNNNQSETKTYSFGENINFSK